MAGVLDLYPNDPARTALYNYENAPGLLSGLLGAYLGGTRNQLTGQAGLAQQQQQATSTAAQAAGVSEPQANLLGLNPAALQAIMPKFQQTGQNIYGNAQYGFVNPLQQTVEAPRGSGTQSAVNEDQPLFGQLPKSEQSLIDAMREGKAPMPTAFALSKPVWAMRVAAADQRDKELGGQGFDATVWKLRNDTRSNFQPGGTSGKTIGALDTVGGHLEKGSNAVERLKGSDWSLLQGAYNALARNTPIDKEQRDALNEWSNAKTAIEDEMAKAYKGGSMSDAEIARWNALIGDAKSPQDLKRALKDFSDLLYTKRQQLINQHKGIMGYEPAGVSNDIERVNKVINQRFSGAGTRTESKEAAQTRTINGKTYFKQGNQWFEQ